MGALIGLAIWINDGFGSPTSCHILAAKAARLYERRPRSVRELQRDDASDDQSHAGKSG